jgi:hypothetical protein
MATDICGTDFLDVPECRRQWAGRECGTPGFLPLRDCGIYSNNNFRKPIAMCLTRSLPAYLWALLVPTVDSGVLGSPTSPFVLNQSIVE